MASVLDVLNAALYDAMAKDERVYLLGEDLLDPYGGAFKVTRGLSTAFPGRVLTTPISEAGIVGLAVGMALRGLRPVVEIMFGDFLTLAADQLINHAAKFGWMYSGGKLPSQAVDVPLVVRTPMGGRRGYGPTHSQSLEKLFLGIPGLRVLAPSHFGAPGELLSRTILETTEPVLFIEHKLLYQLPLFDPPGQPDSGQPDSGQPDSGQPDFDLHAPPFSPSFAEATPTYTLSVSGAPAPVLTICAYGYMAELARQACLQLAYENEIFVELVVPTQLTPCELSPLYDSLHRSRRLLTVEEGSQSSGWGAEIVARAVETLGPALRSAGRLGARDLPVPASGPLEAAVLPGVGEIIQAARRVASA